MTIRPARCAAASIGANRSAKKESQFPETGMFAMPHDHMVKNLDLEELAGADEIAGDADVRLGRRGLAAGMVVFPAIILTRRAFPAWASAEPASRLRNFHPLRPAEPPPHANDLRWAKTANKPAEIAACQAHPGLARCAQPDMGMRTNSPSPAQRQVQADAPKTKFLSVWSSAFRARQLTLVV